MYYSIEDMRKHLEQEIDEAETLATTWRKVKFPTKKDGTPFASMKKNFSGAYYHQWTYATTSYETELSIYPRTEKGFSCNDSIDCFSWDTKEINSVEEIKTKIADRADYWESRACDLRCDLVNLETAYNDFFNSFNDAVKKLNGIAKSSDMESMIRETVLYKVR